MSIRPCQLASSTYRRGGWNISSRLNHRVREVCAMVDDALASGFKASWFCTWTVAGDLRGAIETIPILRTKEF